MKRKRNNNYFKSEREKSGDESLQTIFISLRLPQVLNALKPVFSKEDYGDALSDENAMKNNDKNILPGI